MNQFFIFLYYHFLDYFEKLACTLPCYTFLTPLFHNCNTFTHLLHPLLHSCYTSVTNLLHLCNTHFIHVLHPLLHPFTHLLHLRYTVLTLIITFLMHPYSVVILFGFRFLAFCPCLICGILSGIHANDLFIYHENFKNL